VTYPLFEYFENWCQDENRHGDFFAAVIKAKPGLIEGTQGRLWSRFFCLSVRVWFFFVQFCRGRRTFSRSRARKEEKKTHLFLPLSKTPTALS